MNELLLNAQRARFGQSSERRSYVIPEQLGMFNEAEAEQDHKAPEPTEETLTVKEHQRKRKPKRTVGELTAELPVKEAVLEFPEDELSCSACGHSLKQIGKNFLYEELEIIPQQVRVIKYYSATYACENCEKESGYAHIYSVKAPPRLIKHCLASPSTVANVMTRKYVDGLPLYRQEKIWAREGIALSRATMANWVIQTAQTWRKWREAMPKGTTPATSKAAIGYEYCNKLFTLEKKLSEMSDSVRKTARQVKAEPLLEAYWLWLKTLDPVPGSKLAEAVTYAQNQKLYLSAFLNHGEVDISNNFAENAIRPFAVGRKNWLLSDITKGAESSDVVYTLVETAKANGLDPYAYLLQLLTQLPYLGRNPS